MYRNLIPNRNPVSKLFPFLRENPQTVKKLETAIYS